MVLADGFLNALELLRIGYDRPMIITSGCRSPEHNAAIGGHPRSLHLTENPHHNLQGACAVDIKRPVGSDLHRLLHAATSLGWSIGIAKTFVHLDKRSRYTPLPPVIYTY